VSGFRCPRDLPQVKTDATHCGARINFVTWDEWSKMVECRECLRARIDDLMPQPVEEAPDD
jgi:hypothetical protein